MARNQEPTRPISTLFPANNPVNTGSMGGTQHSMSILVAGSAFGALREGKAELLGVLTLEELEPVDAALNWEIQFSYTLSQRP